MSSRHAASRSCRNFPILRRPSPALLPVARRSTRATPRGAGHVLACRPSEQLREGAVPIMTKVLSVCMLALMASASAVAQKKGCEELAAEIAAKLDAKGVKGYKLDIVGSGEVGDQQVVGSCDAGAKKITYIRTGESRSSSSK